MADGTVPQERRDFYVYVIFRPNGVPCYVGKGQKYRWLEHERAAYNPHLRRIIANAGGSVPKIKIRENLTNQEALEIETALIKAIGRIAAGGPLVNMTDGGDGSVGYAHTADAKAKIADAARGRIVSEATREKLRQNALRQERRKHSRETCAKISTANRGKKRRPESIEKMRLAKTGHAVSAATREKFRAYSLGKTLSAETKKRISASLKANPSHIAQARALGSSFKGTKLSAEHREKVRIANLGAKRSKEAKEAMSLAQKRRFENSIGKQAPWISIGISRRTWYRKRKQLLIAQTPAPSSRK